MVIQPHPPLHLKLPLSLNNMRTALHCIESNLFINFYGILMKSKLQYLSRLTTNECNII